VDNVLTAVGEGEAELKVILKDCTDIEPNELFITIQVGAAETEFSCYIDGNDKIRLGREQIYTV